MRYLASCIASSVVAIVLACRVCDAAVFIERQGLWPDDWPVILEAFRARARTLDVGTGIQERIYEVPFRSSEEFERFWPAFLKVRTPGSPLRLQKVDTAPLGSWGSIVSNATPKVRIYAPSDGYSISPTVDTRADAGNRTRADTEQLVRKGLALHAGAPWPAELASKGGELPEYVQSETRNGRMVWVAAEVGKGRPGFYNRARVDIELVVDGKVIDLNRIEIPADAEIIDQRFSKMLKESEE